MQWKFTGGKPVYQQIMEHMRFAILTGQYPPGARVPAVRDLAMEANVNPNTMQRALMELEREGLLVCCGTMGRFVTSETATLAQARSSVQSSVVASCARQLASVGLTLEQAAALHAAEEKEETQCNM